MEAKYFEIPLVVHCKCNIGGKGKNLGLKHLTELWYGELNFFVGYAHGGKIPWNHLGYAFQVNIGGKGENSGLKASDRTLVQGTKFFCLLCLWRQNTLKSSWLCISSAILVEKGKTLDLKHLTQLWYGELNFFVCYANGGKIPWNHLGYAFQVQYWLKREKLGA